MTSTPDLSFVLSTTAELNDVLQTLTYISQQTIADRIELLIVTRKHEQSWTVPENIRSAMYDVKYVRLDNFNAVFEAFFHGTQLATAPYIVMIEDHVFPSPQWAEKILDAHQNGYDVVASGMKNGNPDTVLSWGNMLLDYGDFVIPTATGAVDKVPLHNVSFSRAVFERFGDTFLNLFAREGGLLDALHQEHFQMYMVDGTAIAHVNPSRLKSTINIRFDVGRLYAANRAMSQQWGVMKRLLYIGGAPLIPFIRLYRCWNWYFAGGKRGGEASRALSGLFFCLMIDALGQMVGYAVGMGEADVRLQHVDVVGRVIHIVPNDIRLLRRSGN